MQIQMTAIQQLTGDYGFVHAGQHFEVPEEVAESLESRGLAYRRRQQPAIEPKQIESAPQNKAIQPEQNKKRR